MLQEERGWNPLGSALPTRPERARIVRPVGAGNVALEICLKRGVVNLVGQATSVPHNTDLESEEAEHGGSRAGNPGGTLP
jgi:hypothetical protein